VPPLRLWAKGDQMHRSKPSTRRGEHLFHCECQASRYKSARVGGSPDRPRRRFDANSA
jgi:hypothetical protein